MSFPRGPKSWTPLGQLLPFRRDALGFLSRLAREYGDIARFKLGGVNVVLLNHPDYVRDVLQTNNRNFIKGRPLHLAKHLLGEGLLTSEGELHLRQSRHVQPAFHAERIQAYGAAMTAYTTAWSAGWSDGATRDVLGEMTGLATAIAGKTMFDWEVDSAAARGIGAALSDAMSLFSRASLPFAELLLKVPLPSTRRFFRAKGRLDAVIYGLVAERRAEARRDRGDLLSMLLFAQDGGDAEAGMTDRQVRDEALTLFLTALDTTSLALTWTWYLLSQHPDAEAELHAEIDRELGGRVPTTADIERLPYTRGVFTEALRLYPPIYAIAREAIAAFEIGGCIVPPGTLVLLSPYVMHRDPRYYPDPGRFDPGRWAPQHAAHRPRFAYFPFGGGPRGCIGQSYALLEGVLVLATLARQWRMRLAPGHVVAFQPLINLRPKFGMRMILEHRAAV